MIHIRCRGHDWPQLNGSQLASYSASPPQAQECWGGFMRADQKQVCSLERFVVVAMILVVSAIAIQNVLHSVKASEERSINHAAVQYAAVRSMYTEQRRSMPASVVRANATF